MDVISGLLIYFGRCVDLTGVDVSPILMKRNDAVNLYGLGNFHDIRLAWLFLDTEVTI